MAKDFMKNIIVFAAVFIICVGALLLVCKIPRSAIHENSRASSEYFTDNAGFPVLLDGHANTRMDNYADCVLFNVIYNVDEDNAFYSVIAAPYYRIEGNDARKDYAGAVIEGKEPNNEYSRYWHGSQIFIRPLLTVASIEGIRLILFGLLAALNIVLAALLLRRRQYAPAIIYFVSLVLVQFWMCAFTIEYIMSFLVMTAACIAVVLAREKYMTYIFIVSGAVTCFLDFLTSETLTFTVPFILFLLLRRQAEKAAGSGLDHNRSADRSAIPTETFRIRFIRLVKWGCAWLASYAAMFGIKWALVYGVVGKSAFFNALENASYRIEGAVALGEASGEAATAGQRVFLGLLRNIACLLPASDRLSAGAVAGVALGILAALTAALYLFRGKRIDGPIIGILLLVAAIPYLRYLCLSNHAFIHYFFTYRAQMAAIMALIAIMVYNLKPSYILSQKADSTKKGSGGKPAKPGKSGGGGGRKTAVAGKQKNKKKR